MSEFGIRIKNYAAGSIIEKNLGVRDFYDSKDAMLTNSLFKDYMVEHGLNIYKGESTRDIIGLTFKYGSRSYEEEKAHLKKRIKEWENNTKINEEEKQQKIDYLNQLSEKAEENKEKFKKYNRNDLRILFYTQGLDIYYPIYKKKEIVGQEKIHYKMLYRSAGKAKQGSCMFIREELYDIARDYLYMGVQLPEKNAPIVEIGAYSSLVASTIIGKVKINPKNILVLEDVDSFFTTNVISVETDENKHCHAIFKENYQLKNTLFDGQALIDHSLFPEWGDGYILLRQHMCKMAAFDCYLQQWFKDYYGDNYEDAVIKDMWGNEHKVSDIELVTTNNAMKWLKISKEITYNYWCERTTQDNHNYFGIVKTAHQSKLGDVQYQSYQMVNALNIDTLDNVLQCTKDYVYQLKNDRQTFLDYLKKNSNFSNDFEPLIALVKQDPDFFQSEYFKQRKDRIIRTYITNAKMGRIINNGDNLTIVGSPYAMLLYAVGENPETDPTFKQEKGCIQCFTERFNDGEYLAEFRNPFNSRHNLGYLHNHYDWRFDKYFNIGRNCIAVNMVHTDFQDRNNGSDMDSDSIFTTNERNIVNHAKQCVVKYPTIVNNIPNEKNIYDSSLLSFAKIDNKLAASQANIGGSSNLAQICQSYSYSFPDKKYKDYTCILAVLAQNAIDSAKKSSVVDLDVEIDLIRKDMDISSNGYPIFWKSIKKRNDKRNGLKLDKLTDKQIQKRNAMFNEKIICPMNSLYNANISERTNNITKTYPMEMFFKEYKMDVGGKRSAKVKQLIDKYSLKLLSYNQENDLDDNENSDNYLLLRDDFDQLISDLRQIAFNKNTIGLMSYLIDHAFLIKPETKNNKKQFGDNLYKNKSLLLKVLYELNSEMVLKCFSKNIEKKG